MMCALVSKNSMQKKYVCVSQKLARTMIMLALLLKYIGELLICVCFCSSFKRTRKARDDRVRVFPKTVNYYKMLKSTANCWSI
jgi:hypothetical protein